MRRPGHAGDADDRLCAGEKAENPLEMYQSDFCTVAANLAGIPAISVPCGLTGRACPSACSSSGRPCLGTGSCGRRTVRAGGRRRTRMPNLEVSVE